MSDEETASARCEIADLYFWLGKDAEVFGFTAWATSWLVKQRPLGEPFSTILHDNLWNLYVRS